MARPTRSTDYRCSEGHEFYSYSPTALAACPYPGDAYDDMGDAWRACDRAMRVMFDARDLLCQAALS